MKGNIEALADSVFMAVKGYCSVEFAKTFERLIEPFRKQIEAIPAGKDGRDASAEEVERAATAAVDKAVAALPVPVAGKDGADGPSAEAVAALVRDAVASIPAPTNGADGADGKDADAAAIVAEVLEKISGVLDQIPVPKDGAPGKDADPKAITAEVLKTVTEFLDQIPVPKDGKDADADAIAAKVQAALEAYVPTWVGCAVAALPVPQDGLPGERGADGAAGNDGAPGVDGRDGKDGERGERGADGERGETGADGSIGKDGGAGKDGAHGQNGVDGKDGAQGLPGDPGRDGREGKDGAPGRDALQIDILPAIDETRSYPRGTFAAHRGGIVRALRTTEPVGDDFVAAGWAVVIPAARESVIELNGERLLCIKQVDPMFGRVVTEQKFNLPVQLYRGVYSDEKTYDRGDTATWAGGQWHCNKDGTTDKPGMSDAWTLAVKRGRDGKDGGTPQAAPATVRL